MVVILVAAMVCLGLGQRRGVPARAAVLPPPDRHRDRRRRRDRRPRRVHAADDARPVQAANGIVRRWVRRARHGGVPDPRAAPRADGDERGLADVVAHRPGRRRAGEEEGRGMAWLGGCWFASRLVAGLLVHGLGRRIASRGRLHFTSFTSQPTQPPSLRPFRRLAVPPMLLERREQLGRERRRVARRDVRLARAPASASPG